MKKLCVALGLLGLIWLVKLSYDLSQVSGQLEQLHRQITQVEQAKDNLNDQFVALQRQVQTHLVGTKEEKKLALQIAQSTQQPSAVNPLILVRQQLNLIEFAVQQHQDFYAIEQMQKLTQTLSQYAIAPALQQSLYEALQKDQQSVEQYHNQQQVQLNQLKDVLHDVDHEMQLLLAQKTESYQPQKGFFQRWLTVESADEPQQQLLNQKIVIKEAQLRFVLAQQQLAQGQYAQYQETLDDVINILKIASGYQQTQLYRLLTKAKQISVLPTPKLTASQLLNGQ